jgi:multiple antibiotic resistance protein
VDDFLRALVSFFAIIDPLGNLFVFHLFMQGEAARDRLLPALIAVSVAFAMLLVFSLAGTEVLDFLGISADSFRIAAGLLLLPPAFRLVMEGQPTSAERHGLRPIDLALVPLATPLIAGPGALAASISFADSIGVGVTIAAFSVILGVSLAGFAASGLVFGVLGPSLLRLLARIVGIVLFAIAVDFIVEGIAAVAGWDQVGAVLGQRA